MNHSKTIEKKTALITNANSSLGLELIRQYSKHNYQIFGCCKNLQDSADLLQITKRFPYLKLFQSDINDSLDLEAIAEELGSNPIDLLIHSHEPIINTDDTIENLSAETMQTAFNFNTLAPLNVIKTFYKNILASNEKKIVCFYNGMANINTVSGSYTYKASMAALLAILKSFAIELQKVDIKVLLIQPELEEKNASDLEQKVETIIKVIKTFEGKEVAPCLNYKGESIGCYFKNH